MAPSTKTIQVDPSVFDPEALTPEVHAFHQKLMDIMRGAPKFYEVGPDKYRRMRANGETPLPGYTLIDTASDTEIPSRDGGRKIPCRLVKPTNDKQISGVYLHIHGGGWVLGDEKGQDGYLQYLANATGLVMVSVGYRLAPEHPFPAGPNDCYDAAEWLVDNAESEYGGPLKYVGGESAGGNLGLLVGLHLLQHQTAKYRDFKLKGLFLHYGSFDLTWTPNTYLFAPPEVLVLDRDLMEHYRDVYVPGMTNEQLRDPSVSPMYADLQKLRGRLPPALFTCGTSDVLLDDTIFMSAKYQMAAGETEVLIVPGGVHGYSMFPTDVKGSQADVAMKAVEEFISAHP